MLNFRASFFDVIQANVVASYLEQIFVTMKSIVYKKGTVNER